MTMWTDEANPFEEQDAQEREQAKVKANGPAAHWRDITLIPFADIQPQLDWVWLIEGILMPGQISVGWGPTGSRKTFWWLDLALRIAADMFVFGRRVEPGFVVYVAAEAGKSIFNRVAAWKIEHGFLGRNIPFAVVPHGIDLCHAEKGETTALIEKITQAAGDHSKALVVIDTVNRAMSGGNENSPEDMGNFVVSLDRMRDELTCHVAGVHHPGKNLSLGSRGHYSLPAAVDTEIEFSKDDATKTSLATVIKQRDGEVGAAIPFKVKPVILGTNRAGQIVTSCVVVDSHDTPAKPVKLPTLSVKQKLALDALSHALDVHGQPAPPHNHIPASATVVDEDLWRRFYLSGTSTDGQSEDTRRKAFRDARDALLSKGYAKLFGDLVWIAS
jgi:hypothetical protein